MLQPPAQTESNASMTARHNAKIDSVIAQSHVEPGQPPTTRPNSEPKELNHAPAEEREDR